LLLVKGDMAAPAAVRRSTPALFVVGLRLGAAAFGGLGATMTLIQRELVERRGWLEARDLKDALAFTKPLPGSTVVQVVTFLGWRLGRWPGALAATLAFLVPATVLMTATAAATFALPDAAWARGAVAGVQVAATGLLASAFWRLAREEARSWVTLGMMVTAFIAGLFVSAALVVAVAAAGGLLLHRVRPDA